MRIAQVFTDTYQESHADDEVEQPVPVRRGGAVRIGDTDLARHATPSISALTWDLDEMGRVAARTLLDRIREGHKARDLRPVYLPTRFILRNSGARPRAP